MNNVGVEEASSLFVCFSSEFALFIFVGGRTERASKTSVELAGLTHTAQPRPNFPLDGLGGHNSYILIQRQPHHYCGYENIVFFITSFFENNGIPEIFQKYSHRSAFE